MKQVNININFIRSSQGLHSQLQFIADQLVKPPSSQKAHQLTRRLDRTSSTLKAMKSQAENLLGQSAHNYFEGLEDEIINMYGQIENALMTHQMTQIKKGAAELKKIIELNQVNIKAIHNVKKNIDQFFYKYCPGIEDRKILSEADHILKQAQHSLQGKRISPHHKTPLIDHSEIDPEHYEDLFDIAALIYNGKNKESKSRFNQLPETLKELIHAHLKQLTALLFEDSTETIQALIATANQLIGNGERYPTQKQIDELFLGLQAITHCEEGHTPIISWII